MDTEITKKAKKFAIRLHAGQEYGEGVPYDFHLEDVVTTLEFFGIHSGELKAAAWLHDILEDTKIRYSTLVSEFGKYIADIVYNVTDELGKNRKERHEKTYPKIKTDPLAIIIKLADRISNVKYSYLNDTQYGKFEMYKKEQPDFEAGIRNKQFEKKFTVIKKMWDHLNHMFKNGAK